MLPAVIPAGAAIGAIVLVVVIATKAAGLGQGGGIQTLDGGLAPHGLVFHSEPPTMQRKKCGIEHLEYTFSPYKLARVKRLLILATNWQRNGPGDASCADKQALRLLFVFRWMSNSAGVPFRIATTVLRRFHQLACRSASASRHLLPVCLVCLDPGASRLLLAPAATADPMASTKRFDSPPRVLILLCDFSFSPWKGSDLAMTASQFSGLKRLRGVDWLLIVLTVFSVSMIPSAQAGISHDGARTKADTPNDHERSLAAKILASSNPDTADVDSIRRILAKKPGFALGNLAVARHLLSVQDSMASFDAFHSALMADPELADKTAPFSAFSTVDSLQKFLRPRLKADLRRHPSDSERILRVRQSDDFSRLLAGGCQ